MGWFEGLQGPPVSDWANGAPLCCRVGYSMVMLAPPVKRLGTDGIEWGLQGPPVGGKRVVGILLLLLQYLGLCMDWAGEEAQVSSCVQDRVGWAPPLVPAAWAGAWTRF